MKIELDLTQREADEIRHAKLTPRSSRGDGHWCVERELESASVKLQDAIDRASRG